MEWADLAGDLLVEFAGGYTPESGDSFQIISASEGVSGNFDNVMLPALDSELFWNLDYRVDDVVLEVLTASAADFNLDGKVDGDDLAIWEASYGTNAGGDATGDNATRGDDFLVWQQQLTTTAAPAAAAVPEPTTWALMLAAGTLAALRR